MKRVASAFVTILMLLLFSQPAFAQEVNHTPNREIYSEYVYLYNVDDQKVIYQKNADELAYPASLVKIMTCILALENTPDLRVTVTYPTYVQDYLYNYQRTHGANISLAGMYAGEEMSMQDLLYGLMLRSGNEIAMIIADHVGGGQAAFVELMNRRARELGATRTNFTNPTGLHDPEMVTTARDMAIITRHAMGLPGFMDIVTTISYPVGPTNRNERLDWSNLITMQIPGNSLYYPHVRGIKTGTTPEAGRCYISSATRDGFTYLLVIMQAPLLNQETGSLLEEHYAFNDARNIYDWVFDNFRVKALIEKSRRVHEIPLRLNSDQDFLPLETAERFTALVARDVDPVTSVTRVFEVPESIDAPIQKGDPIGYVKLMLYGEEVGRVALLAAETVEASRLLVLLEQVKAVLQSFWFKFAVIFTVLLVLLYIILMILRNRNRRRSSYRPRRRI